MSEQNLETSRRINDLWNAGDMDALRDLYHDDVVMRHPDGWPESGPSVGRDAVFRQFERLRQDWRSDRLEVLERRAAGDCVVVRQRWRAQGRHSGVTSEMTISAVSRHREGKIVTLAFYWDHAEALAAAGIQERAGRAPAESA